MGKSLVGVGVEVGVVVEVGVGVVVGVGVGVGVGVEVGVEVVVGVPMKLTLDAGEQSLFVQSIRASRATEPERTGVHCSTIVNDMIARNENKAREPMVESLSMSFQEVGNAIEDLLAGMLSERFPGWEKPDPQTYHGVICSPDGWSPRDFCIDEVKATWKGTKEFVQLREVQGADRGFAARTFGDVIDLTKDGYAGTWEVVEASPKLQGYLDQVYFYMAAWKARRARLHVFFLNGNYRPPFPEPVTLHLRPTHDEVSRGFHKVVRHGMDIGLLTGKEPAHE